MSKQTILDTVIRFREQLETAIDNVYDIEQSVSDTQSKLSGLEDELDDLEGQLESFGEATSPSNKCDCDYYEEVSGSEVRQAIESLKHFKDVSFGSGSYDKKAKAHKLLVEAKEILDSI